jgi:hypothetical protein
MKTRWDLGPLRGQHGQMVNENQVPSPATEGINILCESFWKPWEQISRTLDRLN